MVEGVLHCGLEYRCSSASGADGCTEAHVDDVGTVVDRVSHGTEHRRRRKATARRHARLHRHHLRPWGDTHDAHPVQPSGDDARHMGAVVVRRRGRVEIGIGVVHAEVPSGTVVDERVVVVVDAVAARLAGVHPPLTVEVGVRRRDAGVDHGHHHTCAGRGTPGGYHVGVGTCHAGQAGTLVRVSGVQQRPLLRLHRVVHRAQHEVVDDVDHSGHVQQRCTVARGGDGEGARRHHRHALHTLDGTQLIGHHAVVMAGVGNVGRSITADHHMVELVVPLHRGGQRIGHRHLDRRRCHGRRRGERPHHGDGHECARAEQTEPLLGTPPRCTSLFHGVGPA